MIFLKVLKFLCMIFVLSFSFFLALPSTKRVETSGLLYLKINGLSVMVDKKRINTAKVCTNVDGTLDEESVHTFCDCMLNWLHDLHDLFSNMLLRVNFQFFSHWIKKQFEKQKYALNVFVCKSRPDLNGQISLSKKVVVIWMAVVAFIYRSPMFVWVCVWMFWLK